MSKIKAYAMSSPTAKFEQISLERPAVLRSDQVRLKILYCGLCHSDLSMAKNDWQFTMYPIVPGHEAIGEVLETGDAVTTVKKGDHVGLGWFSGSCLSCDSCMSGAHNLCATAEQTIVGRAGAFAEETVCHWSWAVPLPQGLDPAKAGPLFCGGITAFNPFVQCGVKPTDRVGIIGIGGLGHLALQFARAWGCEVVAFTSTASKTAEAKKFGAHEVIALEDPNALQPWVGKFDFILSTVNVTLNWSEILACLAPQGKFHTVGAIAEPIAIQAFQLISGQKSISGSPLGSPALLRKMLDFCVRHNILPQTEEFPMSQINQAFEHLEQGKARFRIVLKNDF